ncbi:hypothetical protein DH2020_012537 [Rehmannia glutinosa]|uniref:Transcription repressor n=1 Tax=Rehmannia glutinosa TaxID=99300 RepID=A0ABR0X0Y7_REHGL
MEKSDRHHTAILPFKNPSNLPRDPVPSFSPPPIFSLPKYQAHSAAVNHHLSSAFISGGSDETTTGPHPLHFKWHKEDKFHVIAKGETPARLSVFKKLIPCTVDGKVKESFAVVKRSEDPYGDFKRSMMDMILEKQMFEQRDLEQLLQCFLSLNSRDYHGIIVQAFSEIWEAIFFSPASSGLSGGRHLRRVSGIASS